jgi:hypothetical protein
MMSMNPSAVAVMVTADTPCRKCGYNLRGLSIDGRCPECGTPVGVSVNGYFLRYSDPQYIRKLRRGVRFMLWDVLVAIMAGIGIVVLLIAIPASANSPIPKVVMMAAGVLGVVGAWLLTEPDPSGIGEEQYGTARKIIRVTLLIGVFHSLFDLVLDTAAPAHAGVRIVIQGLALIVSLIGLVGEAAKLSYLSKFAMRLPDYDLAERSRFLMRALPLSLGIIVVLGAVQELVGGSGGIVVGCGTGLAGLASLIFFIMYLKILLRFSRALDEQGAIAQDAWSRATT